MGRPEGATAVVICHIQFRNLEGTLERVCLPDCLKDSGEGALKFHVIWDALPDCVLIHT